MAGFTSDRLFIQSYETSDNLLMTILLFSREIGHYLIAGVL